MSGSWALAGRRFGAAAFLVLTALGFAIMSSSASGQSGQDARDLIQALLNDGRLAKYWHFDTQPGRVPLRLANVSGRDIDGPALTADGRPVLLVDGGREAVSIRSLTFDAGGATIRFSYPPEGLEGEAAMVRAAQSWVIEKIDLKER